MTYEDEEHFDVSSFLRGELKASFGGAKLHAQSWLTGETLILSAEDLLLLSQIPADSWIESWCLDCEGLTLTQSEERLARLIDAGIVLSDLSDETAKKRLHREQRVEEAQWPTRVFERHQWNIQIENGLAEAAVKPDYESRLETAAESADAFVRRCGMPPSPVFSVEGRKRVSLQEPRGKGEFFEVLLSRKTSRLFDTKVKMSNDVMCTLLKYVFGVWGAYRVGSFHRLLHKTSPSGGGLHPIEAFPMVMGVDNVEPGLYHYNCIGHHMDLVKDLSEEAVRDLGRVVAQDQSHASKAHLLVVLVARWRRNFWKYHERPNTYNVVMMDAGHLSQTFYLTATALGLGAFYTAALNHKVMLEALGLDDVEFGSVGICGCGLVKSEATDLPLEKNLSLGEA